MKQEVRSSCPTAPEPHNCDSSKLLSLLTLAAGAVAMPQTSKADIIVTDLSAHPVTVVGNTNSSFLIDNLPGLGAGQAQLRFQGDARSARPATSHSVRASRVGFGYLRMATDKQGFVLPVAAGKT